MAFSVNVGSFTAPTSTGSQVFAHGLGSTPKALIVYGAKAGSGTGFSTDFIQTIGFTDGTTSYSAGTRSDGGLATSEANRRMSAALVTYANDAAGTRAQASFTSWDATNVTINWTIAPFGQEVNFIALGGTDLTNAKVVQWDFNLVAGGDNSVTGVGFKPDCVINFGIALPGGGSAAGAYLGLGAMDKDGNQWANSFAAQDGVTANTSRATYTDRAYYLVNQGEIENNSFSFKSMDSNGFTVNWKTTNTVGQVASLCLKGGSYKVGNFTKPTASQTGNQRIDGVGFKPRGLVFASNRYIGNNFIQPTVHWGMSATSGTAVSKATAVSDRDNVNPTQTYGYQADKALAGIADNGVNFDADLSSFNDDGFTLNWTTAVNFDNLGIVYLAFGDTPASNSAGFRVKVGNFTKRTSVGTQSITGLGFQPKALIFYSVNHNTNGFRNSYYAYLGFTSGSSESYCASFDSVNGVGTSDTSQGMKSKAIVVGGQTVSSDADLQSFDSDGFTLNWTTSDGAGSFVNYLALGGDDLIDTKVVAWTEAGSNGDKQVTGVGFRPDCILHTTTGTTLMGSSSAHARIVFGVMDRYGNQWTNGAFALDSVSPSNTSRVQKADKCLSGVTTGETVYREAQFKSMDADGFTVTYTTTNGATSQQVISLCLKGGAYKVGNFNHTQSTAPSYQSIGGVGFTPVGMLFAHHGDTAGDVTAHADWGFGATNGAHSNKNIAIADQDNQLTTVVNGYQSDHAITMTHGNNTIDEQGKLASFDDGGFSLYWTTTFTGGTSSIGYLAFGSTIIEDTTLDVGTKVKVGSFTKPDTNAVQQVTSLGFRPKAIILFGSGVPVSGFRNSIYQGLGFATGGGIQYSVATFSLETASPSSTSRRIHSSAYTIVRNGDVLESNGYLRSFNADGFTVEWLNDDGAVFSGFVINYIAIGGSDLTDANVITWGTPATAGNKVVTGVGFQPDLVLHSGPLMDDDITTLSTSAPHAGFSFGAMAPSGQWANAFEAVDNANPANTTRAQRTDSCILATGINEAISFRATYVSMDSDGFTTNFATTRTQANLVMSLCLKGPRFKVGNITVNSGTGGQAFTGVGFQAKSLLITGFNWIAQSTPTTHASWTLGAATSSTERKTIAVRDVDNVATTSAQGYQNDLFYAGIHDTSGSTLQQTFDLTSIDPDGFTINRTASPGFNSQQLYLAIGDAATSFIGWGIPI